MKVSFVLYVAMSIIIALFAILNVEAVFVNFGFIQLQVSLALVILGSVGVGALVVFIIDLFTKLKSHKKTKGLKKEITTLTSDNESLNERIKYWETKFKEQELLAKERQLELDRMKVAQPSDKTVISTNEENSSDNEVHKSTDTTDEKNSDNNAEVQ